MLAWPGLAEPSYCLDLMFFLWGSLPIAIMEASYLAGTL